MWGAAAACRSWWWGRRKTCYAAYLRSLPLARHGDHGGRGVQSAGRPAGAGPVGNPAGHRRVRACAGAIRCTCMPALAEFAWAFGVGYAVLE